MPEWPPKRSKNLQICQDSYAMCSICSWTIASQISKRTAWSLSTTLFVFLSFHSKRASMQSLERFSRALAHGMCPIIMAFAAFWRRSNRLHSVTLSFSWSHGYIARRYQTSFSSSHDIAVSRSSGVESWVSPLLWLSHTASTGCQLSTSKGISIAEIAGNKNQCG